MDLGVLIHVLLEEGVIQAVDQTGVKEMMDDVYTLHVFIWSL